MERSALPRLAVTALEAGQILGISRAQVFRLLKENRFPTPARTANHHPRWLISDLEEYLRNSKKPQSN